MQTATSTEVKNKFGEFLEIAQTEPVAIQKHGRNLIMMIPRKEYDRLKAIEDVYWGERAKEAEKGHFLGTKASKKFLEKLMAEKLR